MSLDQWVLYLSMTTLVSLSPGPVMLMCLANGAHKSRRQVILGMFGASAGNVLLMLLSALGLGALVHYWPHAFAAVGVAGACYLIYLGWQIARHANNPIHQQKSANSNTWLSAFYIAVSNPKGILYFGALFPQFISPQRPLIPQLAALTLGFLVLDLAVMEIYARGGKWLTQKLSQGKTLRIFNYSIAGFLIIAGVAMAIQQFNLES